MVLQAPVSELSLCNHESPGLIASRMGVTWILHCHIKFMNSVDPWGVNIGPATDHYIERRDLGSNPDFTFKSLYPFVRGTIMCTLLSTGRAK